MSPIVPEGMYPQLWLCGHVGNAPIKRRISTISRMVPSISASSVVETVLSTGELLPDLIADHAADGRSADGAKRTAASEGSAPHGTNTGPDRRIDASMRHVRASGQANDNRSDRNMVKK
jgi:hypothetical protein